MNLEVHGPALPACTWVLSLWAECPCILTSPHLAGRVLYSGSSSMPCDPPPPPLSAPTLSPLGGCPSPWHLLQLFPAVPRAGAVGDRGSGWLTPAQARMDWAILGAAG